MSTLINHNKVLIYIHLIYNQFQIFFQTWRPSHDDVVEAFSQLSLQNDNNNNLPLEEVEVTSTLREPSPSPSSSRPKRNIKLLESIQSRKGYKRQCLRNHQANIILTSIDAPQSLQEALESIDAKEWQATVTIELTSLEKNNAWSLIPLPANRKPISSKWIFKIKTKADGSIDKYKARLVARGFTQIQGVDYIETFSPTVKLNSIKVLLALAAQFDLKIHQLDVKTAFLYGFIKEDIYMSIPKGLSPPPNTNLVCKLNKSLYGLKQSSRAWYQRLDQYLLLHHYQWLELDANIYLKKEADNGFIIITVYVDDCIIISNHVALIQQVKDTLQKEFDMSDEGDIHYILGNTIIKNKHEGWIMIHQQKYLTNKLKEFNMLNCNPLNTPMQSRICLHKEDKNTSHQKPYPYSQVVGNLMHAIVKTQLDCAYAISSLAQYMSNPSISHIQTLKRTLRYIKGTLSYGIKYQKFAQRYVLYGFSYADWAGDKETRHSTSGYCFILVSGVISWGSKKQQSVALSSTESEYMALAKATAEVVWLRKLLHELGYIQHNSTLIYSDSQSAFALSENPKYHSRSKHVDT